MFKTTETNFIKYILNILIIFFLFPSLSVSQTKNIPLESNRENFKRSVLVISHEKIFNDTNLGKAIFKKFKDKETILLIDAERIEKLFIEEEKELTLSRPNLDTKEFLNLANDFDKRVELERVNQRNKEAVINENLKKWKKIFFNTFMIPIIQDFMKIYEASIVIDIDSNAFKLVIFDSRINITDGVIKRMNNLYKNIDELTLKITS
jgi:Skp family chaperone for outer membrane proteins